MVCEHDWGGHHFIAAELVEGETLRQRLQRSSLSTGAALEIGLRLRPHWPPPTRPASFTGTSSRRT
jgi:hypothetical protein